jgi:hypothetical protein
VKQLLNRKRQFALLLLGLTLALAIIGPLAVGATNPTPASLDCTPQCLRIQTLPTATPNPNAPAFVSIDTGRYYPYPAVSPVWVRVVVARASSVDLIMPGSVTLLSRSARDPSEYLFEVTGLIPYGTYSYEVVAHGVATTTEVGSLTA